MSKIVNDFLLTKQWKECKIEKMEVRKIKKISTQHWISIKEIYSNGIVKTDKNKFIKILKIIPINYNLKSDLEKKTILNSYKILLKTCNFNFQILIQSDKEDLSQHISQIRKNIQKFKNKYLTEISENYIKFIQNINNSNNSSSKNFFIIVSNEKTEASNSIDYIKNELNEKYFKIKECLFRCGNNVIEIQEKEETIKILNTFFNTKKFLKIN